MNLTHRQLSVFRAVMLAGHVTRAAEMLHSSQPTVSRELARLEQVLGLRLFDRVRGRLQPTPAARSLLEEVEQSFLGLERIAATALALREQPQGQLRLACLPALSHALVPQALSALPPVQRQSVAVAISTLESPALEAALSEQRFDLGLTERLEPPGATTGQLLLRAHEVAVLPAGHALSGRAALDLRDFEGERFVSLAVGDPYRQLLDGLFAQAGVRRQMVLETPSAVSVCALVAQGLGVGIVNPLTARALAGPALRVVPLTVEVPFQVALVLPQWRPPHPARAAMVAALRQAAAELAARLPGCEGEQP
ncbi:LysR family transcriptional regulator [Ideonella livida]|uniref:LysR family transcriptional regulator n=1 Tax=Ideonella livida TaxID=2707176 RepID=A0A7C9TIZ4_9BURK|nr:LysR family transcriptional regulator [Ideonella livida]NDY90802.1 LysR family transcriptional regulator [Ideonella livida]